MRAALSPLSRVRHNRRSSFKLQDSRVLTSKPQTRYGLPRSHTALRDIGGQMRQKRYLAAIWQVLVTASTT
ncbi:hypothetical protein BV20DRAFT_971946 [Pilatotrama ljubarskyi]|nr:hypothetical protein BV20DRAFT_971946 [Pilatotrama ljubarskyi]